MSVARTHRIALSVLGTALGLGPIARKPLYTGESSLARTPNLWTPRSLASTDA